MDAALWIACGHAFATIAMTGLIWMVQIVHYPLFAQVGDDEFVAYEAQHCRRISYVVMPLMLTELATAGWLAWLPPSEDVAWASYAGFALLALIWLSTAVLQVPCHRRLEAGRNVATIRRLVTSNWVRTIAWSARAVIAMQLLLAAATCQQR